MNDIRFDRIRLASSRNCQRDHIHELIFLVNLTKTKIVAFKVIQYVRQEKLCGPASFN